MKNKLCAQITLFIPPIRSVTVAEIFLFEPRKRCSRCHFEMGIILYKPYSQLSKLTDPHGV